jgi:hypothetical protein
MNYVFLKCRSFRGYNEYRQRNTPCIVYYILLDVKSWHKFRRQTAAGHGICFFFRRPIATCFGSVLNHLQAIYIYIELFSSSFDGGPFPIRINLKLKVLKTDGRTSGI